MIKTCPTCEAKWIDDQLYWATNKSGSELDLASLVCNPFSRGRTCINPCKGLEGGDTWAKRASNIETISQELK